VLTRFLQPRTEAVYTLVRILVGLMFAFHGAQKILGLLSNFQPPVGSQMWVGGIIELVGGLAVAVGFLTVWAAFLASGEMAVAYLQFHWKLDFGANFFPAVNKGEPAVLYALIFLYVACRGAGRWSLDGLLARRRAGEPASPAAHSASLNG
jgi:putative oxidoreductase